MYFPLFDKESGPSKKYDHQIRCKWFIITFGAKWAMNSKHSNFYISSQSNDRITEKPTLYTTINEILSFVFIFSLNTHLGTFKFPDSSPLVPENLNIIKLWIVWFWILFRTNTTHCFSIPRQTSRFNWHYFWDP